MRMMVTIRVPVAAGNRTIRDGSMGTVIQQTLERIKPECAYFFVEQGRRTMRAVFDLPSPGMQAAWFEPVLWALDAEIEIMPCMTAQELAAGFAEAR
ncbi:MAG: hypothetical protein HY275_12810 [Gemmatimonadetes bacterium]|nr:hypothetical protein [Gemmatimonadota bacterium]